MCVYLTSYPKSNEFIERGCRGGYIFYPPPPLCVKAHLRARASSHLTNHPPLLHHHLLLRAMGGLSFPIASDLWSSPSFQDLLNTSAGGAVWVYNMSQYLGGRQRWELYDTLTDPGETVNLVNVASWSPVLESMQEALQVWQGLTNDAWAIKRSHE